MYVLSWDSLYLFDLDGGPTSPGPQKFCGYPAITPDWPMEEEEARSGIINGVMTVPHSWPWQVGALLSANVHMM